MELTPGQKKVLALLAKSSLKDKFYWTGGTLLAYHYFKHRKSEDLDFFSAEEFSFNEVNQFIQDLKQKMSFNDVQYQNFFDRNEPKDIFDIYFLLTKGKFTTKRLLGLVTEKFGVKLPESLFWSESFKKINLLFRLKPLLLEKDIIKEQRLFRKIEDFFKSESAQFLREKLS